MATLEAILHQATTLIAPYRSSPAEQASVGEPNIFKPAKSILHGEISASREIAAALKQKLDLKGLTEEDILGIQETPPSFIGPLFQKVIFSPQEHLYFSLNRPVVFTNCIQEVTNVASEYGTIRNLSAHPFTLLHHPMSGVERDTMTSATVKSPSLNTITLEEGRGILIMGLLSNLLKNAGHSVNSFTRSILETPHSSELGYLVWHLLQPFGGVAPDSSKSTLRDKHLLEAAAGSMYLVKGTQETSTVDGTGPSGDANTMKSGDHSTLASLVIDGKGFLQATSMSGKGGYDNNIGKIAASDDAGHLTLTGALASEIAEIKQNCCTVVHVVHQRKSFAIQQAMVAADVLQPTSCAQHLLLISGVECSAAGLPTKTCTLAELMEVRLQQMTEACIIKYGDGAKGPQLQEIAQRMAETVVKFELLSADPKATVKMELPGSSIGTDIRFSGAFVLYNYARLATLFQHYRSACEKGMYPPLPEITKIDFSLLKDEDEWQLLFHYVLQYPSIVREAAQLNGIGIGIHIEVGLKKICLFLTKLSHAFSSYYSRVKVLVTPETHLIPLIHARLYLMAAVKQIMYNALAILAIEPLEQL